MEKEKKEKIDKEIKEEKVENTEMINMGIEISADAVASIAAVELDQIKGIDRQGNLFSDISEAFGQRQSSTKGIKVDITGKDVVIDINIMVYYGIRIPDIAFSIQSQVKKAVEAMTGLNVREVNVHVQGVKMEEEK